MKFIDAKCIGVFMTVFFCALLAQAFEMDKAKATLEKLDDYEQCLTHDYRGLMCQDALLRWVEKNPADSFKAGKMTRMKLDDASQALIFFQKAWSTGLGDCKDNDVRLAVLAGLDLSAKDNAVKIAQAKSIAFEKCEKQLVPKITDEARENKNVFANTCKELVAMKLIAGVLAKKCNQLKE